MTVSTMYDTSMDVKIFTFDLAGECVRSLGENDFVKQGFLSEAYCRSESFSQKARSES